MSQKDQHWEAHWRTELDAHAPTPLPDDWSAMEDLLNGGTAAPAEPTLPSAAAGTSSWLLPVLGIAIAAAAGVFFLIRSFGESAADAHAAAYPTEIATTLNPADTIIPVDPNAIPAGRADTRKAYRTYRYDTLYQMDERGNLTRKILQIDTAVLLSLDAPTTSEARPAPGINTPPKPSDPTPERLTEQSITAPVIETSSPPELTDFHHDAESGHRSAQASIPLLPRHNYSPVSKNPKQWQRRLQDAVESGRLRLQLPPSNNGHYPSFRERL